MKKKKRKSRGQGFGQVQMQGELGFIGAMLELAAPGIEAAGNLDRAVRLGIVDGSPDVIGLLREIVPISRGGNLDHRDAERDWIQLVRSCVCERKLDMEALRKQCREAEE
jgi:hypothetical protein